SASFSLLLSVSKRLRPLLVVITTRPFRDQPPAAYRQLLKLPFAQHIELKALTPDETVELVCQRLGVRAVPEPVAAVIREKAQGNPFFSEELAYALRNSGMIVIEDGVCRIADNTNNINSLGLPDTIQGLITTRIDRLTPEQQLTLKVASVIGRTFSFPMLLDIYPVKIDQQMLRHELIWLEQMELIQTEETDPGRMYRFKHIITQEVVYHLMAFAQRRQLHRAIGEWYEQTVPDRLDELSPLLGQHFAQAEDHRAITYFTRAGDVSWGSYAANEALGNYNLAISAIHTQVASRKERRIRQLQEMIDLLTHLYRRRGRVLELHAQYEEALHNYEEMSTLADELDSPALKLAALMAHATLLSTPNPTYQPRQANALLQSAFALARGQQDHQAEARILWNQMLLIVFDQGNPLEGIVYGEQSLTLARELHLEEQEAFTLNDMSMAYLASGQLKRSQEALYQAQHLWRKLDNQPMLTDNLSRLALGYFLSSDYEQAMAASADAGQMSLAIGNLFGQANCRMVIGNIYLERGQFGSALAFMEQALELGQKSGNLMVNIGTRADLAWAYMLLGDGERGLELAQHAVQLADEHHLLRPWAFASLARIMIRRGQPGEAHTLLQTLFATLQPEANHLLGSIYVPLASCELALIDGDYQRVIHEAERLIAYLTQGQMGSYIAETLLLKGRALLALNLLDQAYDVLQMARLDAEMLQLRRPLWSILAVLSQCESQRGHLDAAALWLQQAGETIEVIAEHIDVPEQRAAFYALPDVQAVMTATLSRNSDD
ncbi:MAG: hypothetical protein HC837_19810, partial [Chloroflexaceae bacterium]|nr:hypothetical protein [Chloroflexaceae bacterium]